MTKTILEVSQLTKNNIIGHKIGIEGGASDNPDDRGGRTKYGITEGLFKQVKGAVIEQFGPVESVYDVTPEIAYWIYETEFWDKLELDEIIGEFPVLADHLFDFGINAGWMTAGKSLQRYLTVMNNKGRYYPDLVVDGLIGRRTRSALRAYVDLRGIEGQVRLIIGLLCTQGDHYLDCSEDREDNETFVYGWIARVEEHILRYRSLLNQYR